MELDNLLVWIVGASCVLSILRILRAGPNVGRGWLVICGAILAVLALLLLTRPELAARVTAPAWGVFLLAPSLGSRLLSWLLLRRKYRVAIPLSRVLAALHPFDGWREQPDLVRVLALHDAVRVEEASTLLEGARLDTPLGRSAYVLDTRARGTWEQLAAWVESSGHPDALLGELTMMSAYLRALGETGRRADMIATWRRTAPLRARWSGHLVVHIMRMHLAALTGRPSAVEAFFEGPLSEMSDEMRRFWIATAEQVAGRTEEAAARLQTVGAESGDDLQREARRRLEQPLPPLADDELDGDARHLLAELETDLAHDRRFAVLGPGGGHRLRATWAVAALLLAVYLAELPGGSEDHDNLVSMGALVVPTSSTPGEWWRRFTAGFLHFGHLHVSLNVLALLYLGRWLERAWGWRRFLVCYLAATFVSTALFPDLITLEPGETRILVGASGGILGLLGALLGHTLVGSMRRRTKGVVRQMGFLALLVAFQLLFDQQTPEVSSLCHALGLATGLVVGLAVGRAIDQDGAAAPATG